MDGPSLLLHEEDQHMRKILTTIFLFAGLMFGAEGQANSESLLILGGLNNLYGFDSATPGIISTTTSITGLRPGEFIRGIDFRPANGQLYGISLSSVYIINPQTGAATLVSNLSTPLDSVAGVDFDPVEDRLRVVNDITLKNQRIDVDTGQVTDDAPLKYAMGDPNAFEPPHLTGIAFSFDGVTSTTLYGIDSGFFQSGQLVTLNQPETGIINSIGPTGVRTTNNVGLVGFDISELTNTAYAVLTPDSNFNVFSDHLYTIDLSTGAATLVGAIGNGRFTVTGLAAPVRLSQAPVPEPTTVLLLASGVVGVLFKTRKRHQVR
jgi:hypothetical protein